MRLNLNSTYYLLLFIPILLIILNPYTIYGKPGIIFAGIFALFTLLKGIQKPFFINILLPTFFLLILSCFGVVSSFANGIPQMNHPLSIISLLILILSAYGFFLLNRKINISKDNFFLLIILAIFLNSLIILLELQFPTLRNLIEGYLDPISAGSINYAEGFRLRGIASSGGAGLSVSIPAALIIAFYLFDRGSINFFFLLILFFTFLASVIVIGRTGLVLLTIPFATYLILIISRRNNVQAILKTLFFVLIFSALVIPIFYEYIVIFFTNMFGDDFIKYAFGFLLEGGSGIEEEGTVSLVLEYLKVLPMEFPQALTGYGFYGGSYFDPWTDGGFSRTFLSIGFLLGSIFYFTVYYMFMLPYRANKFLIGSFVILLTIAEIKEPLLFSGVGSRMFIFILVYCYCEDKYLKFKKT